MESFDPLDSQDADKSKPQEISPKRKLPVPKLKSSASDLRSSPVPNLGKIKPPKKPDPVVVEESTEDSIERTSINKYKAKASKVRIEKAKAAEEADFQEWKKNAIKYFSIICVITLIVIIMNCLQRRREDNWTPITAKIGYTYIEKDKFKQRNRYLIYITYKVGAQIWWPVHRVSEREFLTYKEGENIEILIHPEESHRWRFPGKYSGIVGWYNAATLLLLCMIVLYAVLNYRSYRNQTNVRFDDEV